MTEGKIKNDTGKSKEPKEESKGEKEQGTSSRGLGRNKEEPEARPSPGWGGPSMG